MIRIFRLLIPASIIVLFLSEAVLIVAAYAFATWLLEDGVSLTDPHQWHPIAVVAGLILVAMYLCRMYVDLRIRNRLLLIQSLFAVMGSVLISQALLKYLDLYWAMQQNSLLLGSVLTLGLLFGWRLLFEEAIRNKTALRRVMFWGRSHLTLNLLEHLNNHPELGFLPVGYLDWAAQDPCDSYYLGTPGELSQVMESHRPDWVVINAPHDVGEEQMQDLIALRFGGVETTTAAACYEMIFGRVCASRIELQELFLESYLQPHPVSVRWQLMWTRSVALITLPLTIPLFLLLALAVWSNDSRQPVLIRETKVGYRGRPLVTWRFRTLERDSLIYWFIARFGLDKLPQVWNVLLGQMSFVGPDADVPEFAERLNRNIPFHSQRTSIRPGITGWAQINQRIDGSQGDAIRRIEYDLYYVQNLTPVLDLFVLLRWLRDGGA